MVGGTLLQPQSFLRHDRPLSSPTCYKHQITHLGRVDIVISAEIFFFWFRREEREKPDGRAQTYPTYPGMLAAQAKRIHIASTLHTCPSDLGEFQFML